MGSVIVGTDRESGSQLGSFFSLHISPSSSSVGKLVFLAELLRCPSSGIVQVCESGSIPDPFEIPICGSS
jgi:hypothetical protein